MIVNFFFASLDSNFVFYAGCWHQNFLWMKIDSLGLIKTS